MTSKKSYTLPRLLYLADVPVESSYHGSALIYRLLEDYPPDRLVILEPTSQLSQVNRRMPRVTYKPVRMGWPKLMNSRFADFYGSWVLWMAPHRQHQVEVTLSGFQPEAVLSVTHGYSWLTASTFAKRHCLPAHLICHDEWLSGVRALGGMKTWASNTFGDCYRRASSRLCVSPRMAEQYYDRYGCSASVLYPSRAKACPTATEPATRLSHARSEPVFAFAGTINSPGYAEALRSLASHLKKFGGTLLLYGPTDKSRAKAFGLSHENILLRGMLKSDELILRLREEADVLFVPMSFYAIDRFNMELSFPSKLTDYTAVGLPLLIRGPEYCSAVRWARENPGVAEVVDTEAEQNFEASIKRLAQHPNHRVQLALRALEVGARYFSHQTAQQTFFTSLSCSRDNMSSGRDSIELGR
jgi:hypothetical protein